MKTLFEKPGVHDAGHPTGPAMTTHLRKRDRFLIGIERALGATFGKALAQRPYPAADQPHAHLDARQRRHAAGLMRVDHTGEVCAQALYLGQAALAHEPGNRAHLLNAAAEETDHLAWCGQRLHELGSRPSVFNPVWYAGSYAIGALAALASDRVSLGFVVETERQVEAHLGDHLQRLPVADQRSRAILTRMQADEARHGQAARERGGIDLPFPLPQLMHAASSVMKAVAYRM